MESIKIINKNKIEKIIDDWQKNFKNESSSNISTETVQNNPKRQIEKYMNSLSFYEQTDLYTFMFFGREVLENGTEANLELFIKSREQAATLIEQYGFHANYLTGKEKLALYFNKSFKIYEILDNSKGFKF